MLQAPSMKRPARSLHWAVQLLITLVSVALLAVAIPLVDLKSSGRAPIRIPNPAPLYVVSSGPSQDLTELEAQVTKPAVTFGWVPRVEMPTLGSTKANTVWPCYTYVNLVYKYIYVKQFKTASTTLRRLLSECKYPGAQPWCLSANIEANPQTNSLVVRNWSDFTVFTTVRNPWARAVSNYNYLVGKMSDAPQCKGVDWDAYCRDPFSLSKLCKQHPECAVLRTADLIGKHVHQQSTCLVDKSGGWIVDFIARTETLESDLAPVLDVINSRRTVGLPPIVLKPMTVVNPTNVCTDDPLPQKRVNGTKVALQTPRERYCNASEYFVHHPHCLGAVAESYKDDLHLLY